MSTSGGCFLMQVIASFAASSARRVATRELRFAVFLDGLAGPGSQHARLF
jgi:hypothetical protein